MTALLSLDSKNFTPACDGCGQSHRLAVTVCLVGPAQQVRDALWLLNLDRLFPTCPILPEALSDGQAVGAVLASAGVPRPDRVEAL